MKKIIPQSIKNIYHLILAIIAKVIFGSKKGKMKIIGVTGTNGKTTTVQMIAKILEKAGFRVALASTINFKLGEKEWVNATKFTTLSPFAVQKFIARAVKANCDYLVLETSSHSLDQYRVWGVEYDTAVITNVTREHLDYHKTMEEYRRAKLKLFKKAKAVVVNLDMERPETFFRFKNEKKLVYSSKYDVSSMEFLEMEKKYDNLKLINAENIKLEISSSSFVTHNTSFMLRIPGLFNVENALAAISVGIAEKIDIEKMSMALAEIQKVPGRMDGVDNKLGLKIIIDYALTPDSMEKLGELVMNIKKPENKLIWVFGSCGERDRGKRPMMGEIVARYADYVLVTNEDPYGENEVEIINQVFSGVVGNEVSGALPNFQFPISNFQTNSDEQITNGKKWEEGKNCWRIFDRREAISIALKLAKAGDIVLVTGKGAEETMAIGEERIPWNDRKVIEEELRKI